MNVWTLKECSRICLILTIMAAFFVSASRSAGVKHSGVSSPKPFTEGMGAGDVGLKSDDTPVPINDTERVNSSNLSADATQCDHMKPSLCKSGLVGTISTQSHGVLVPVMDKDETPDISEQPGLSIGRPQIAIGFPIMGIPVGDPLDEEIPAFLDGPAVAPSGPTDGGSIIDMGNPVRVGPPLIGIPIGNPLPGSPVPMPLPAVGNQFRVQPLVDEVPSQETSSEPRLSISLFSNPAASNSTGSAAKRIINLNVGASDPLQCTGGESFTQLTVEDICGEISREKLSCVGRCGKAKAFPCSCHTSCVVHKTCCYDFKSICPDLAASAQEQIDKFPGIGSVCEDSLKTPLISECPESAGEEEKRLCRLGNDSNVGLLNFTPVSDDVLEWSFRNRYCWLCWKTGNSASRWRINVTMSNSQRMEEDYSLSSLGNFMAEHPDLVTWYPPNDVVKGQCNSRVVSRCTACAVPKSTEELCRDGDHSYISVNSVVYKNLYCFLCSKNFERDADELCMYFNVEQSPLHQMNFPVTMILPESDELGEIELIQDKFVPGSYNWDRMVCSSITAECTALECNLAILEDGGRCNPNMTPLTLSFGICAIDFADGGALCRRNISEPSFEEKFKTDLDEILQSVIALSNEVVNRYMEPPHELVKASIVDEPGLDMKITVTWKMSLFFLIPPEVWRNWNFEVNQILGRLHADGMFAHFSAWARQLNNENPYYYSYHVAHLCHQGMESSACVVVDNFNILLLGLGCVIALMMLRRVQ